MHGVCSGQPLSLLYCSVSTYRCADLHVELARGIPVVHGVKGGDLVDTHGRHLQYPRYLIHDADAREAMLALSEVEERHHGGLLVLRRVPRDNLLDELLVLRRELEGDFGIVLRRIAVLYVMSAIAIATLRAARGMLPTTKSESLRAGRETLNARHCARWNWREARGTLLNMKGTSFEAMVVVLRAGAMAYIEDVNDGAIRNSWHWHC
jgi:hypothetical protein